MLAGGERVFVERDGRRTLAGFNTLSRAVRASTVNRCHQVSLSNQ
jgi:hypothetical protein